MSNILKGSLLSGGLMVIGRFKIIKKPSDVKSIKKDDIVFISRKLLKGDGTIIIYKLIAKGCMGIITNTGGKTDHGTVVASEFGIARLLIPENKDTNRLLEYFNNRTVSFNKNTISIVENKSLEKRSIHTEYRKKRFFPTEHQVKISIGFPEILTKYPELIEISDGIGQIRLEFLMLSILKGYHPEYYIHKNGLHNFVLKLADELEKIVAPFAKAHKDVMICTNDFVPVDLAFFKGGKNELIEKNSALGYRGIRRSLDEKQTMLVPEVLAVKHLVDKGYTNLGIFAPMSRFKHEYDDWKKSIIKLGLKNVKFGLQVEVPSIALTIEDFNDDIDFVSFGSNDLTQFTLALDRTNEKLFKYFNESEKAVLILFERVIKHCLKYNIPTDICGQAGSNWIIVKKLIDIGLSSVSVAPNPELVYKMKKNIYRLEQKV